MKSTGSACSLLLLTMAAVSSGRNATEYFQQARFQHTPSRPEDTLVFFTANAPPLICEQEGVGDWIGGDRFKADFILIRGSDRPYYTCSFEGNNTAHSNLKLIEEGLPGVFTYRREQKIEFDSSNIACTSDSQLPDEYFQLRIQRPSEERPVKCRKRDLDKRVYLRFPGYPSIICPAYESYRFKLRGIVGDWLECAFQVYSYIWTHDKHTEKRLHESLVGGLPTRVDGGLPDVVCSHHAKRHGTAHFQVRLPGDAIYDCSFSDI